MPGTPEFFFVFADTADPMCWHNLRFTKSIMSSGYAAAASDPGFLEHYLKGTAVYAPFVPNDARTTGFISKFAISAASNYQVEYDAEYVRFTRYGTLPSRLSAVYAFGSMDECEKASIKHRWPLERVKRFRLAEHPLARVHRANMEIISLMRTVYPRASWNAKERDDIWQHYWSGGGSITVKIPAIINDCPQQKGYSSGEIWEYLVEGKLELADA